MALQPKISADLIRARDLGPAVENAIKLAEVKIGRIEPGENIYVPRWEIVGRRLRDMIKAEQFAQEVTANINAKAIGGGGLGLTVKTKAVPAVFKFDKFIIAGFIERINIPVFRGL